MKKFPIPIRYFPLLMLCFFSYLCLPVATFGQCTGGWNVTYNNVTVTTATTHTNIRIRIIGTVNFNANVTLTQCVVDMDPGATLNIGNNSTFSIYDNPSTVTPTFIQACNAMWNAINRVVAMQLLDNQCHFLSTTIWCHVERSPAILGL